MVRTPTKQSTRLTYAQLEDVWISAGGSKSMAPLMAAIAEAESGGDPYSLNATDNNGTQSSYGLWQISTGTHAAPASNWYDPAENAKLAIGKLNSQGLGAWGTYTSGAYKQFMQNSTTPDNSWQGLWPGGATQGGQGIAGIGGSSAGSDTCLMKIDYGIGSTCLMSKTNARALIGGLLILGSMVLFTAGGIVLVTAGFRKAAPAVGAIAKGPVGMLVGAASKSGTGTVSESKTKTETVPKEEPKPAESVPSGGTGRHRGPSGEKSDKTSGKGKRRGKSAPLPEKSSKSSNEPEDEKPGPGKRRKVAA